MKQKLQHKLQQTLLTEMKMVALGIEADKKGGEMYQENVGFSLGT